MVRLAALLVGGDAAAEEVVQEAFLRVRDRWARVEHPAAYLRAAVVNGCRSHQRRQRLEERRRQDGPVRESGPPTEPLGDAIASLPYRQRAAVVLRYYEDLSERDIAAALGCSPSAVKSLLHRALTGLREVIEP